MTKSFLLKIALVLIVSYCLAHSSAAPQEANKQFNYTPDEVHNNDHEETNGQEVNVDQRINWEGLVHGLKTMSEGFNKAWAALQDRGSFAEGENNNEVETSNNNNQKIE